MMPYWSCPDDWYGDWVPAASSREAIETDVRIADQAALALLEDTRVHGRHLEILVQNRVLILIGEASSERARAAAGAVAWAVPEVFDVCNRLTLPPRPEGAAG
ncbi:BON domain-containing protein [Paractinoplanes atraurantiacus]|uniref:BON domain-containing protein n=1 Tax=Paractinoplanes atraurantiacus TaxID=1036182 RepID=A0A285GPT0_9ACTN|nr:BON domain-containing protein [Actinoplanes atraurantiacus]SNY25572.1 BON domain-containing protein [Actinoplanes atraurantiacus]